MDGRKWRQSETICPLPFTTEAPGAVPGLMPVYQSAQCGLTDHQLPPPPAAAGRTPVTGTEPRGPALNDFIVIQAQGPVPALPGAERAQQCGNHAGRPAGGGTGSRLGPLGRGVPRPFRPPDAPVEAWERKGTTASGRSPVWMGGNLPASCFLQPRPPGSEGVGPTPTPTPGGGEAESQAPAGSDLPSPPVCAPWATSS